MYILFSCGQELLFNKSLKIDEIYYRKVTFKAVNLFKIFKFGSDCHIVHIKYI